MTSATQTTTLAAPGPFFDDDAIADIVWMIASRGAGPTPVVAPDAPDATVGADGCSMVGCVRPATLQVDLGDVVVDLTEADPVCLCSDHAFDRLAAMSRSRLSV